MKNFWNGKCILVSGGKGFLGRAIVKQLEAKKCKEIIVPEHKDYDLRRRDDVDCLYRMSNPNIVIHCAASVGGIGAIKDAPGKMFYDNIVMGCEMMDKAREFKISKFVAVGSSCLYPDNLQPPFKEKDMWQGYPNKIVAPYALAKKMLLVMSQSYRRQYRFNSIYLIPTNLYGPQDNFNLKTCHVIPALIKKFTEGKNVVEVWGTGHASREFLHVEDCARAIVLATEKYNGIAPINIGSGEETPLKVLVEMIRTYTNFKGRIVWNTSKPDGKPRCGLDVSRAWKEFGFKARIPLEIGLKDTIEWYEKTQTAKTHKKTSR